MPRPLALQCLNASSKPDSHAFKSQLFRSQLLLGRCIGLAPAGQASAAEPAVYKAETDGRASLGHACCGVRCLMAGCLACSYWGEALRWGPQHRLDSAAACCEACLDYQPDTEDGMGCNGELDLSPTVTSTFTKTHHGHLLWMLQALFALQAPAAQVGRSEAPVT